MAERVSIYGPDAVAALLVRHASAFCRDGVRNLRDCGGIRSAVLEEVLSYLCSELNNLERLTLKFPLELHWRDERDVCAAIIASLRALLPSEPEPETPAEGVSAC